MYPTELFWESSWSSASHWHRFASAAWHEHLSTLDEVVDCTIDLCGYKSALALEILQVLHGACDQMSSSACHLQIVGEIRACPHEYPAIHSSVRSDVPSNCVWKADESSRGAAELAPAHPSIAALDIHLPIFHT